MQILFRAFLTIYLAHLLTDFIFQTNGMVSRKRNGALSGYFHHGLIHFVTALLLSAFFLKGSLLLFRTYFVLLALTFVHLLIDAAKIRLTRTGTLRDGSLAYVSDQLIHLLTVALAAWLLTPGPVITQFISYAASIRNAPSKWLALPAVYTIVVFGGGYLIRYLTRTMSEGLKSHSPDKPHDQLQNAGLYIGWLERFLVVTALMLQSPATIGLILTAKSIARYPEFKSERFAEYFLIGTLLSIAIAMLGGMFLTKLFFGSIRLSG